MDANSGTVYADILLFSRREFDTSRQSHPVSPRSNSFTDADYRAGPINVSRKATQLLQYLDHHARIGAVAGCMSYRWRHE